MNKKNFILLCAIAAICRLGDVAIVNAAESQMLWQIGAPDNQNAEFALAPAGWAKFRQDAFFVIGESNPRQDWPYVQPGPADGWARNRQHTFAILFALKSPPIEGECRIVVRLVDTHHYAAPKLRIQVNGRKFEQVLPNGTTGESLDGSLAKGRPFKFEILFPSRLLHAGNNDIEITTLEGSWMLYDSVGLETPVGAELTSVTSHTIITEAEPIRALRNEAGESRQPVLITVRHLDEPKDATLQIEGAPPQPLRLKHGEQAIEMRVPAADHEITRKVILESGGQTLVSRAVLIKPARKLTIYVLPHSHTDIGYTEIQSAVAKKQVNNLIDGIAVARRTANYPEGARFVWNVEVLWAADLYLHRLNEEQRTAFFDAVKKGQVVLNGMYLNELTGLCSPEGLVRLFREATRVSEETGVPIDSAMISDVPGYTWGTVTALKSAGIKYFSVAPNYFDRIGTILREWENKPFYWVGPDGSSKVLVWIPYRGYAMSHIYNSMSPKLVDDFYNALDKQNYPYDIAYMRWSGHGDNSIPDPSICEFIKDWNTKYSWPHFVISGTSEAFRALEQQYGDKLPVMRGDWTPYWEDGAGSSALETAMNRHNSDRLAQAETVFAMLNPSAYPAFLFEDAWKNVLLYSEHTWGAWCSIGEPERKETKEQWAVKKSYADQGQQQSRELLAQALQADPPGGRVPSSEVDIFNTLSWQRNGLVTLSRELSSAGNCVFDKHGTSLPSQRLKSGELAFLAKQVPPFATGRYTISPGVPHVKHPTVANGLTLENEIVQLRVDEQTGGIIELTARGLKGNLVATNSGESLNDYLYLRGDDLKDLQHGGRATISVGEEGPLVASLIVESDAPGCNHLRRELRIVAGQDYIEIIDLVDKARLEAKSYYANEGKESVNFAFPFNVPDGEILLDIPLGVMRPEEDQIPGACKNWFTVGRWADVSNRERGITWVTLDAPLVEIGELSATLLNSQTNPDVWRKKVKRTQRFYSWVMNNHWSTNYRAYQEGPTIFRFILRPHRKFDSAEASRFAAGFGQPLLPRTVRGESPSKPLLRVAPADVIVSTLKPSDDGNAWIVRLFGASGISRSATLQWGDHARNDVYLSDTSEKPGKKIAGPISVPGYGLVTLRIER